MKNNDLSCCGIETPHTLSLTHREHATSIDKDSCVLLKYDTSGRTDKTIFFKRKPSLNVTIAVNLLMLNIPYRREREKKGLFIIPLSGFNVGRTHGEGGKWETCFWWTAKQITWIVHVIHNIFWTFMPNLCSQGRKKIVPVSLNPCL